jgi:hypothetical protein
MLHTNAKHREVRRIACSQSRADADSRRCDETISLMDSNAPTRMVATPRTGELTLSDVQRGESQAAKEAPGGDLLRRSDPTPNLLDRYCADPGFISTAPHLSEATLRGTAAQHVDQDRRVEQNASHVSRRVARRIVDFSPIRLDRHPNRFQFVPSTFVIECPADKGRQEGTALPLPKAGVQLADEFIGELYVHSHVPMIAHTN